ncbi:glutathione peroxidase [Candidatus Uabimicrobium sp. HlEnr_7]|uniref:glutathione peroxidase n=1 Tax=Candidatus Uabimicrobium helgolandensis TaxID=3095367 RepID=UPI0035561B6D
MLKKILCLLLMCSVIFAEKDVKKSEKPIYDVAITTIDGKKAKMSDYKGKVVLIVNVASECGFTYQYEGLQKIYAKYQKQGFVVLGFPTNDFGKQEPGSNKEIQNFCTSRFKVTFPMFAKITVKGKSKHPLYGLLTKKDTNEKFHGEITWNFNKFLVDKNGNVVARFGPRSKPQDEVMTSAIEGALKDKK